MEEIIKKPQLMPHFVYDSKFDSQVATKLEIS